MSDGFLQKKTRVGEELRKRTPIPKYQTMYSKCLTDDFRVPPDNFFFLSGEKQLWYLLSERVLVREMTEDWVTKSGLIIPEHLRQEEEYFSWGEVHAVGERVTEDICKGDRVLFEPFAGVPDGDGRLFVWQKHVWAVVR